MATNILMPALSPTMTEGTLARWLKKEGESVSAGDVIAEIETDKATMEVEAVDEGVLSRILVPDGTPNVAVNAPIAILMEAGEAVSAQTVSGAPQSPPPARQSTSQESPAPAEARTSYEAPARTTSGGHDANAGRIIASPLARRLAEAHGIQLASLRGTGPNGRIVRADVEAARQQPGFESSKSTSSAQPTPSQPAPPPAALQVPAITAPHRVVPHTTMRRVIARRLTDAKQTVPHFYLSTDIHLDALLALRADLNARSAADGPDAFKLSVNDLIIKAAAATLCKVPAVNASFTEEGTVLYENVDISVAVAIPDGLVTPIIRHADRKGLAVISNEMKALASRAKAGKLRPEEFQGGGFSISNLGMFGIKNFAAIVNPPQGAILAVGTGEPRAVVHGGALGVATVMTCTLSVDHRVIDGALGAQFLQVFKSMIEDPLGIML